MIFIKSMITIVTINLNNKNGLRRTIESVISQTYFDKIEYIIIDGGSTDGSVDVIKEYEDKISYWVSENGEIWSKSPNTIYPINFCTYTILYYYYINL